MNLHKPLVLITFIFSFTPTLLSAPYNLPIAKPTCQDHCGGIAIPYPFGTTEECYQSRPFMVTCNHTYTPPKLFWVESTIEITDISLDGQLKILQDIAHDCYDRHGNNTSSSSPWLQLARYHTVNNTANKFTIVGCDSYAYVSGKRLDREYMTGCTAMCDAEDDLKEGSCLGVGCCQTPIPGNVSEIEVDVKSYSNYTNVWEFDKCGYAFVVEDKAFNFSPENLTNLRWTETLPMVVDWAIGNGTCEDAKKNTSAYACVSLNSFCYKPENGYGYRCHCDEGFQGNPYLSNGCHDIDECVDGTQNCTKKEYCNNTKGSYTCSCPMGYEGDGRGEDGCIAPGKKQDMKIAYVLIGIAFGITILLLAAILLYLELKR